VAPTATDSATAPASPVTEQTGAHVAFDVAALVNGGEPALTQRTAQDSTQPLPAASSAAPPRQWQPRRHVRSYSENFRHTAQALLKANFGDGALLTAPHKQPTHVHRRSPTAPTDIAPVQSAAELLAAGSLLVHISELTVSVLIAFQRFVC
jgi:hypothetical protein